MMAATRGHADVVKLLVEHEGNITDSKGWTALMRATWSGHLECVKLLSKKEAGDTNLQECSVL